MNLSSLEQNILLNEEQAASILGLKSRTLTTWRWRGQGPIYVKVGGRIRYATADLRAFIDAGVANDRA